MIQKSKKYSYTPKKPTLLKLQNLIKSKNAELTDIKNKDNVNSYAIIKCENNHIFKKFFNALFFRKEWCKECKKIEEFNEIKKIV